VLGASAITASNYFCGQTLQIRWRRWLTANYVSSWMAQGRHYRVRFVAPEVDNIHLRIASDVYLFIQRTHELTTGLLGSVATLVSFSYILWGLSAVTPLPLFGMDLSFPGYLIAGALLYALSGTLIAHWIGWRLIPLNFSQQRFESDFRFAIVRAAVFVCGRDSRPSGECRIRPEPPYVRDTKVGSDPCVESSSPGLAF